MLDCVKQMQVLREAGVCAVNLLHFYVGIADDDAAGGAFAGAVVGSGVVWMLVAGAILAA